MKAGGLLSLLMPLPPCSGPAQVFCWILPSCLTQSSAATSPAPSLDVAPKPQQL